MRKHRLLVLMVLCGWSASADLSGDVNGDGAVNAADLVRARKIADGELAFEPAADVDGDSAVTKVDVWLIQEAVLGRSVPERVAGAWIGPAGGTLSHGNITVTIPPGSSGQTHLSLMRCAEDALDDGMPLHEVYMVCGLSTNLAGVAVSYANCGDDTGLCAGSYLQPHDAGEMQWNWHAFPESGFVRSGTQVSRSFAPPGDSDLAVAHSVKFALLTADEPPPVTQAMTLAARPEPVPTSIPGNRYAGYLYTGWISDKFEVYTKDWGTVTYDNLETVCGILYDIYGKIQAMGFPLDTTHASIFPLEVHLRRGMTDDGGFVYNPVTGAQWIELKASLLSNPAEMKATLGHELMHYVLNEYQGGNAFAFESVEDAITTWFEAVAAGNPDHQSGNHTARRAAPLKALFQPITRGWLGGRD
ncbi:MAG: dockerin type I repeat-containing protein, partial [Kiritimatiellia bacterium]